MTETTRQDYSLETREPKMVIDVCCYFINQAGVKLPKLYSGFWEGFAYVDVCKRREEERFGREAYVHLRVEERESLTIQNLMRSKHTKFIVSGVLVTQEIVDKARIELNAL